MTRTLATLATTALLAAFPAPALAADDPGGYSCELYAADLQDRLSTSVALAYGLQAQIDTLTTQRDRAVAQRDRKSARIERLLARIERLRAHR